MLTRRASAYLAAMPLGPRKYQPCRHSLTRLSWLCAQVLENINWPAEMPFGPDDFQRYDESTDDIFYSQPRFVTHIDDGAIGALTE